MDTLNSLLGTSPFWGWFALGVAFLLAELVSGTTYLLWPAVAAGVVGVLSLMGINGWQFSWICFAALTIGLTIIGHRFVKPRMMISTQPDLNERSTQLIGARGLAASAFSGAYGRMKLGDTEWRAELVSGDAEPGTMLEVVAVDGATLKVKAAS